MLAKLTSKNQLTLPKSVVEAVGASQYLDVVVRDGQIVLTPVRIQRGDAVRAKLAALGVNTANVEDAVRWARARGKSSEVAEPAARNRASQGAPALLVGKKITRRA
jgi:antitoxin component of MazEF toxin-antitoxin module